jgi:hypothetical protein
MERFVLRAEANWSNEKHLKTQKTRVRYRKRAGMCISCHRGMTDLEFQLDLMSEQGQAYAAEA